ENDEDRVDHLLKLRELQDETHGFQTFIPLAFHPDNTPLEHLPKTTGMLDIKQIAVSRLVLDNFPHIKAYWQMMTPKIAQIALSVLVVAGIMVLRVKSDPMEKESVREFLSDAKPKQDAPAPPKSAT